MHLIGPDALDEGSRARLRAHPKVELHPPVRADEVPSWTKGLDVVLSPHVVTPFTLSLDAIKSYEYLASGRPVVATPTSGFQLLTARQGLRVVPAKEFVAAMRAAVSLAGAEPLLDDIGWAARAQLFVTQLRPDAGVAR